jgi:magnesium transporter
VFGLTKKLHAPRGLPPGTLVHVGEQKVEKVRMTVIDYDGESFQEKVVGGVEECFSYKDKPTTTWINVDGVHDVEIVGKLGACYGIHPLVLEDVVNTVQRPKMLDFGDYIFLSLKMLYFEDGAGDQVKVEQVSVIFGANFVLSFQEDVGDVFDPVRDRIRKGTGKIRRSGPDYLAYSLIDSIVDGYFAVFEWLGERIEEVQERLIVDPTLENLQSIHRLKSETIELRKAVWPLREVIANLERVESPLVRKDTLIFLRNVYGHTIEIIETIESFRDLIAGMIDIYLSSLSMKLNEVMKVLTIIATIFIPLTFVVGIYGMNFKYMPEIGWRYGYPMVMLVVLAIGVSMLVYFRKKRWL